MGLTVRGFTFLSAAKCSKIIKRQLSAGPNAEKKPDYIEGAFSMYKIFCGTFAQIYNFGQRKKKQLKYVTLLCFYQKFREMTNPRNFLISSFIYEEFS